MPHLARACRVAASLVLAGVATGVATGVSTAAAQAGGTAPALEHLAIPSGGSVMNGIIYIAAGRGPHPTVLLLHGYPGDEQNLDLAQALRRAGWNVATFHYRGSWGSEGRFSYAHELEDVRAALAFLRADSTARALRIDPARLALVGHSMGGGAALLTAAADPGVRCVAGLAPFDMGGFVGMQRADTARLRETLASLAAPHGPVQWVDLADAMRDVTANAERYAVVRQAAGLRGRPVLVVTGRRDRDVPAPLTAPVVAGLRAAGASLTAESLDADHAFSQARLPLIRLVSDWLGRRCRG